jgi:hypothetical protein
VFENVVARDGIEPPTPAFSGLDSLRAILFITNGKSDLNVLREAERVLNYARLQAI